MRRVLTAWVGVFDKAFVVWVSLALALMLPASRLQNLVTVDCAQEAGLSAVLQAQHPDDEGQLPSAPPEEAPFQLLNLLEDDEVVHETHVFVVLGLSFKLMSVEQLKPNSLHTRELERPPLHTV